MSTVRAHIGGLGDLGEAKARRQEAALARAAAGQRRESASADDLRAHTPAPAIAPDDFVDFVLPVLPASLVDVQDDPRTARAGERLLRPVAALLSAVVPGVGQVAVGHPMRGLKWYAAAWIGWASGLFAAANGLPRVMWFSVAIALALHLGAAVDGWRAARTPKPLGPTWLDSAAALVAGLLLAALPMAGLAQARVRYVTSLPVQTPSMYPTLEVGDRLLVERRVRSFSRGDLMVFRYPRNPTTNYVKRVIGVGGDVVEVRGDAITVNGQVIPRTGIDEPCRAEGPEGAAACAMWSETLAGHHYRVAERAPDKTTVTIEVPPGHYFVVGDNRDGSNDSRLFGTVPAAEVLGRATFVWWSLHQRGVRWGRINRVLQ